MHTVRIISGSYHDSVHLMRVSAAAEALPGVARALVAMATEANCDLAATLGFEIPAGASPDQLMILVDHDGSRDEPTLLEAIGTILRQRATSDESDGFRPRTLDAALAELPGASLAVISVAGSYAAREAEAALDRGLHVMLFSDNVPVEEEIRLKRRAASEGCLVMGPDCGTAIIEGIPLCFANAVRRGSIGIVAASGTGLQEVSSLIHRLGGGVSHAIGTGGRDLTLREAPAITTRMGLAMLGLDSGTDVIVVVSKPPVAAVVPTLLAALELLTKPVVLHLVGGVPDGISVPASVTLTDSLAETAEVACRLAGVEAIEGKLVGAAAGLASPRAAVAPAVSQRIAERAARWTPKRRYVRGLYCGGTLADELIVVASRSLGPIASVSATAWGPALASPAVSEGHSVVDLGEDVFTVGRPHPMIDPTIRLERLRTEAADPATAVIVLDFVLGTGAHEDPVGVTVPLLKSVLAEPDAPIVIAVVVGTDGDRQDDRASRQALEEAGVLVARSNADAALIAIEAIALLEARRPGEATDGNDARNREARPSAGTHPREGKAVGMGASAGATARTGAPASMGASTTAPASIATPRPFGTTPLGIINIGVADFARDMRAAGARVVELDWRPPARGNARMADLLKKLGR